MKTAFRFLVTVYLVLPTVERGHAGAASNPAEAAQEGLILETEEIDISTVPVGAFAVIIHGREMPHSVSGEWGPLVTSRGYIKSVDEKTLTLALGRDGRLWRITLQCIQTLVLVGAHPPTSADRESRRPDVAVETEAAAASIPIVDPGDCAFDVENQQINQLRSSKKNFWHLGISARRISFDIPGNCRYLNCLYSYRGVSFFAKRVRDLNLDFKVNFSIGTEEQQGGFLSWAGADLTGYIHTIIPRTFFYGGVGGIWLGTAAGERRRSRLVGRSQEDYRYASLLQMASEANPFFEYVRLGAGFSIPMPEKLNLGVEIGLGLATYAIVGSALIEANVYLDREIR